MILTVLTEAKLTAITPQFLVLDLRAACTFYAEKLGFHVAFTYSDFYAGVERDGVTIHLKLSDSPDPSRQAKQRDSHLGATGNTINKELCAAKYCTIEFPPDSAVLASLFFSAWYHRERHVQEL